MMPRRLDDSLYAFCPQSTNEVGSHAEFWPGIVVLYTIYKYTYTNKSWAEQPGAK